MKPKTKEVLYFILCVLWGSLLVIYGGSDLVNWINGYGEYEPKVGVK